MAVTITIIGVLVSLSLYLWVRAEIRLRGKLNRYPGDAAFWKSWKKHKWEEWHRH